ncbi:alpha/beta hydrolase [Puniceibacterium sediminis]|uniref:Acetyl esterase/lipase n=1 Tax=Puniceibacterium sediminis TaxID=1608407 RepID=A0A238WQ41_9RHOB|nr:alpha/beta hydrolase [Puniceibacterium sediminis]SNR47789.1 Acetyl esterase/lipase [Puniceibacterium sediminis]
MSWQLRLLNAQMRFLAKPKMRRTVGPEEADRDFARSARWLFRTPPYLRHLERPGGLHWICAGTCAPDRVILYLHGGAYVSGHPLTHIGMLGRLSQLSGIEVCAPRYRLAQQARFPAAFDDAVAAFRQLESLGYHPQDIVLGGDSAGGGLMLALLAWCCAQEKVPRAAFAFSPWTDLAATGASLESNRGNDSLLPVERMAEIVQIYLCGADPRDPRASPLYADFPGTPPVLIQISDTEVLRDDGLRMAERLRSFGAAVTVEREADCPHVWQIFDGWLPEARTSLRHAADFIQDSFADISR